MYVYVQAVVWGWTQGQAGTSQCSIATRQEYAPLSDEPGVVV